MNPYVPPRSARDRKRIIARRGAAVAAAVGAACLMSRLHGAEPGLAAGVFFWGQDATGMGQGVTFPSEVVDLAATDHVLYCLSRDGNVTQIAGGGSYQEFQVPPEATNVIAVSAGAYHMIALRADGHVIAWGAPGLVSRDLILAVPLDLTNAVAIAAGAEHCLALRADGRITTWGINRKGQLDVPVGLSNVVALAAGTAYSIALKQDGSMVDWGDAALYGNPLVRPELTNVTAIALGHTGTHGLALRADGTVVGWQGSCAAVDEWSVPAGLSNVVAISAGPLQCYAVGLDGIVVAWGWNNNGQTQVPPDLRGVTRAVGGSSFAAAITPAPRILDPPGYISADAGRDAEFNLRLLNQPNARIQWWLNDFPIPGATNVSLLLTNLQAEHAGTCTVVVASALWPEQSASARLDVRPIAPWFLESPQDHSARPGGSVELRCPARGTEPISYQWLRNGEPLEGATQPILSFPSLTLQQGGFYTLVARNEVGTSLGATAYLQVLASGQLLAPQMQVDGRFRFQLSVEPAQSYHLQTSQDLVNWEDWLGFVSTDGSLELEDPGSTSTALRFYRLVSP